MNKKYTKASFINKENNSLLVIENIDKVQKSRSGTKWVIIKDDEIQEVLSVETFELIEKEQIAIKEQLKQWLRNQTIEIIKAKKKDIEDEDFTYMIKLNGNDFDTISTPLQDIEQYMVVEEQERLIQHKGETND